MTMRVCNVEAEAGLLQTIDQCISDVLLGPGSGHGHVQAHEPAGGPQDHGGDQEGGGVRGAAAGQLHGQDPGAAEHGPLRRPLQPNKAPGCLQALGGEDHGGVLSAGRQGEGRRDGHLPNV